ncbi:MAG: hypothetical protein ACK40G_12375 [Cytophagaceae bacterium]
MNRLLSIISILCLLPQMSFAFGNKKYETFSILGFFVLVVIGLSIYYYYWKAAKDGHGKYIYTKEIGIRNGKKVVITKKHKVTERPKARKSATPRAKKLV